MNKAKEDLLLHPVRLRIIQAIGLRQATAQQLARELPDIPQATLYRHINTLVAAGILTVVGERRVHNTLEKTYALVHEGEFLTPEDVKDASPEDLTRLFTRYLGQLLGYYMRYIQQDNIDLVRDRVGFQMLPFYLSEAEAKQLGQALNDVLLPYLRNEPSPERHRFILGVISLPDVASTPSPSGSQAGTPAVESTDASRESQNSGSKEGYHV